MGMMIDQPEQIRAWFMLSQLGALRLECKGIKHSSGRSIAKHVRDTYGLQCGRKKLDVLFAFQIYLLNNGVLSPESLTDADLIYLYVKHDLHEKKLTSLFITEYKRRGWLNSRMQTTAKYGKALMSARLSYDLV